MFQHPTITLHPTPDPRVHLFRSAPEVDCFAVVAQRFVAVIDTFSTPQEAAQMMNFLVPELKGRDLIVINTHQHYDHAWGNTLFASGGPYAAPIMAHASGLDVLSSAQFKSGWAKASQEPRFASVRIIPPNITFTDRLTLYGGDITLELIPAPGHAQDQVVVWIPEIRFLLAADALEHPWPYPESPAHLPALIQTFQALKNLGPAVILPCHGGTQDTGLIDRNLAYFARLAEVVREKAVSDNWKTREDLADALGYPMAQALSELGLAESVGNAFYADLHEKNLRASIAGREKA